MRTFKQSILTCGLFALASSAAAQKLWLVDEQLPNASREALSPAATSAVVVRQQLDLSGRAALALTLSDGSELLVQRTREEIAGDTVSWVGKVVGDLESTVVLTQLRRGEIKHLAGYIQSKKQVYELSPSAQGTVLMRIDEHKFPNCGGTPALPQSQQANVESIQADVEAVAQLPLAQDVANEIDVLMVFKPGSVTQLGGEIGARTFAQNAVNVSNTAFENSQMIARFQLAGVMFTTDADIGTARGELTWLINSTQVASRREAVRADMVSVIAEFGDACGVGYLMNQLSTGFANNAFQATARGCAIGNLSYPHEHGHNMGLTHDPGNGANTLFPQYGFGHFISGSYRTVMSYSNNCVGGCTRVPYFSNPLVTYNAAPTGIANQRDNALAGNTTAPFVANFRAGLSIIFANGLE